jgi:hypothetical protein
MWSSSMGLSLAGESRNQSHSAGRRSLEVLGGWSFYAAAFISYAVAPLSNCPVIPLLFVQRKVRFT